MPMYKCLCVCLSVDIERLARCYTTHDLAKDDRTPGFVKLTSVDQPPHAIPELVNCVSCGDLHREMQTVLGR